MPDVDIISMNNLTSCTLREGKNLMTVPMKGPDCRVLACRSVESPSTQQRQLRFLVVPSTFI